jgi:hypothetical protein
MNVRQQETTPRRNIAGFDCELPEDVRTELLKPKRARILGEPLIPTQQAEHPSHRAERILQPQRARILAKPPAPKKRSWLDSARRWWHPAFGWLLALVFVVAVVAVSRPSPEKRAAALRESAERSREAEVKAAEALKDLKSPPSPAPVFQPTPAVQPMPTAMPTPSGVVPIPAPRAMLVKLPPPRAQLVRLSQPRVDLVEIAPSHVDETHTIWMPYGTQVRATLRGFLENENQLPQVGRIGDMYVVGNIPWIWIQVPGTTAPTWIDP